MIGGKNNKLCLFLITTMGLSVCINNEIYADQCYFNYLIAAKGVYVLKNNHIEIII